MSANLDKTTERKAQSFEALMPLLEAMYSEFRDLAKKSPDAPVSVSKIKIASRLLEKVLDILEGQESLAFLDLPEADDLPQYSDITLLLSQYVAAMKGFKNRYWDYEAIHPSWNIGD
jgi:hypothetical protein